MIQLSSILSFMSKLIQHSETPQQAVKELLASLTGHLIFDFQDKNWVESTAPYIEYLYNLRQAKGNEGQFSLGKFSKQFQFLLLTFIGENSSEKVVFEEPATDIEKSEWISDEARNVFN